MAVHEWELVNVLIYLLSQLDGHLVLDFQVSENGGRLQCVLAPIANADHHAVLGIQRRQLARHLGDRLGRGAGCTIRRIRLAFPNILWACEPVGRGVGVSPSYGINGVGERTVRLA